MVHLVYTNQPDRRPGPPALALGCSADHLGDAANTGSSLEGSRSPCEDAVFVDERI